MVNGKLWVDLQAWTNCAPDTDWAVQTSKTSEMCPTFWALKICLVKMKTSLDINNRCIGKTIKKL